MKTELAFYSLWLIAAGLWLIWSNTREQRKAKRRRAMLASAVEEARRRAQ